MTDLCKLEPPSVAEPDLYQANYPAHSAHQAHSTMSRFHHTFFFKLFFLDCWQRSPFLADDSRYFAKTRLRICFLNVFTGFACENDVTVIEKGGDGREKGKDGGEKE